MVSDLELVVAREHVEVRPAGHGAVLVHDLHDDGRGLETRETREVAACLRVPRPGEHPSGLRAQGEDVPGLDEVLGAGVGAHRGPDRPGPVVGGDAGADAVRRVDGYGEHRPVRLGVVLDHRRHADLIAPLGGHRQADEAARVAGHEVDVVGLDVLGGDDEVALVLAALVVDEDHHPAVPELFDEHLRRMEPGVCAHVGFGSVRPALGAPCGIGFPGHGRFVGSCRLARSAMSRVESRVCAHVGLGSVRSVAPFSSRST